MGGAQLLDNQHVTLSNPQNERDSMLDLVDDAILVNPDFSNVSGDTALRLILQLRDEIRSLRQDIAKLCSEQNHPIKDHALFEICNHDEGVYCLVLQKLEKSTGPKDIYEILNILVDRKCIQSKDMFNRGLVNMLLDRSPNYSGKKDFRSIRTSFYR